MELPRGMKDFTWSETANIEHIRSHFKQLSNLYGFSFMDPSPIELLSTLETKSGPAIRDEIYYFKDKGDREIALRFDFTMGLTRYATSQKSMKLPAKISSFGGVFRYDEPQKGRYRYFHQWDLEIYGKANLESESEIIELTSRLFDSLLLKNITIDVNHRNLVESYINKIFDSKDSKLVGDMLRAVDKIAKKIKAGQFIILRVNETGERIPLTVADKDEFAGIITLIFQIVGKTTALLGSLNEGNLIKDISGPLGMAADCEKVGTVVMVGGGTGVAILHHVAKAFKEAGNYVIGIIGARDKNMLILEDEMSYICDELIITTDDGSYGRQGFVTQPLEKYLEERFDIKLVYAIGPIIMMKNVANLTKKIQYTNHG